MEKAKEPPPSPPQKTGFKKLGKALRADTDPEKRPVDQGHGQEAGGTQAEPETPREQSDNPSSTAEEP